MKKILTILIMILLLTGCGTKNSSSAGSNASTLNDSNPTATPSIVPTLEATPQPTVAPTGEPAIALADAMKEYKSYEDGIFEVGKDIEAGEYVVMPNKEEKAAAIQVGNELITDKNGSYISEQVMYQTNVDSGVGFVTISKNEYVMFYDATAYKIEDYITCISNQKVVSEDTKFKVGINLEPGTYTLKNINPFFKDDPTAAAGYSIYSDSIYTDETKENGVVFLNTTTVTVKDGEYLLLNSCEFVD